MIATALLFLLLQSLPIPGTSSISYFIENGEGVPGYEAGDRELAEFALAAWARESSGRVKLSPAGDPSEALLRVRWIAAGDGRFGEMQRMNVQGRQGAIVFVSPSVATLGETFAARASNDKLFRDTIVYLTCVHEIGHALGLPHTSDFADIMYSFAYGGDLAGYFLRYRSKLQTRADIRRFSGLSPGDAAVLKALH